MLLQQRQQRKRQQETRKELLSLPTIMANLKNEHIPTEKTRAEVKSLSAFGITQEKVADYLDIALKTLRKHYRRELDTALVSANFKVAQYLYKNAVDNENVSAQIFWLKTKGGWKEEKDETAPDSGIDALLKALADRLPL